MLLEGKNSIIYGGGGAIGGAVARAFAREGARVHLAGRTLAPLDHVADIIRDGGGWADTTTVDALDQQAVDDHADAVATRSGSLDISFNLISTGDVQGTPLVEMSLTDFEAPILTSIRTQFLTARAAARHMIKQGSGVILMFGLSGDPIRDFTTGGHQISMGGTKVAFGALDVFRNQLACELGPNGIRVVTLLTGGVPETTDEAWRSVITDGFIATSMLRRAETLEDVGNVAAFAASNQARGMTATHFNLTSGREVD